MLLYRGGSRRGCEGASAFWRGGIGWRHSAVSPVSAVAPLWLDSSFYTHTHTHRLWIRETVERSYKSFIAPYQMREVQIHHVRFYFLADLLTPTVCMTWLCRVVVQTGDLQLDLCYVLAKALLSFSPLTAIFAFKAVIKHFFRPLWQESALLGKSCMQRCTRLCVCVCEAAS